LPQTRQALPESRCGITVRGGVNKWRIIRPVWLGVQAPGAMIDGWQRGFAYAAFR
jgi:hypothetical protein